MMSLDTSKEGLDKNQQENKSMTTLPSLNRRKSKTENKEKNALPSDKVIMSKYGNLKTALDALEPIHEFDEKNIDKDVIINEDLFRTRKYAPVETEPDLDIHSLDKINEFNSTIMKNDAWGSEINKKSKYKQIIPTPHKPGLKNINSEVGKDISLTS